MIREFFIGLLFTALYVTLVGFMIVSMAGCSPGPLPIDHPGNFYPDDAKCDPKWNPFCKG